VGLKVFGLPASAYVLLLAPALALALALASSASGRRLDSSRADFRTTLKTKIPDPDSLPPA